MSERKFRRALSKPGSAAVARETISAAVRQSTLWVHPCLVDPIDYETFLLNHRRTLLTSDPFQRDLLLFPSDDISAQTIARKLRTTTTSITPSTASSLPPLHVRQCIETFTRPQWKIIVFRYEQRYSSWASGYCSPFTGLSLGCQQLPPKTVNMNMILMMGKNNQQQQQQQSCLQHQVYEIDGDGDDFDGGAGDEEDGAGGGGGDSGLSKEGYILRGSEAGTDSFLSVATKSFKRRWMCLRQEPLDGTCFLTFFKDNRKIEGTSKGTICLEFVQQILRNSRRGKLSFELKMIEGHKPCILATETEVELESWIEVLTKAIQQQCKSETTSRKSVALSEGGSSTPPTTPKYGGGVGTLKSLEFSKNPELMKYSRETDYSIGQARKENRTNIFALYKPATNEIQATTRGGQYSHSAVLGPGFGSTQTPSMTPLPLPQEENEENVGKVKFLFTCSSINFNLKTTTSTSKSHNVEPFFTFVSIFHTKLGKLTEEYRFDANDQIIREETVKLLNPSKLSSESSCQQLNDEQREEEGRSPPYPSSWICNPSSAIFSVHSPSPEMYLVMRIEKVLSGSISSTTEPYIKATASSSTTNESSASSKLGAKMHKASKSTCQRMASASSSSPCPSSGLYRMPFGWAARPIFKYNASTKQVVLAATVTAGKDGEGEGEEEFGTIYRQEGNKLTDEDIVKHLNDLSRNEKPRNVTIIPGKVSVSLRPLDAKDKQPPANVVTSNHLPVVPFPSPPIGPPTIEVQEFILTNPREAFPFTTTFTNLLYIFPKNLKFDGQKVFPKARNISVCVEFRDNDEDATAPGLELIFARIPGFGEQFVSRVTTPVLHHQTCPDFYDEIKLLLPTNLHERQHILFTFYHVSCSGGTKNKGKEATGGKKGASGIDVPVGYAWIPIYPLKGRLNLEEQMLPISSHLPSGYLSYKPLGLGRGFSGPEIKWVDGGKEIFRVAFKLVSSVFPNDSSLHTFFVFSDKMLEGGNEGETTTASGGGNNRFSRCSADSSNSSAFDHQNGSKEFSSFVKVQHGMPKILKALLELGDIGEIIRFFPTLMTQLLKLLVTTTSDDVSQNIVRVLIHVLHSLHEVHKEDIALNYVEYYFTSETVCVDNNKTNAMPTRATITLVHEELIRSLVSLLRSISASSTSTTPNGGGEFTLINNLLAHLSFFFQITVKSMANHLLASGRIKMHRNERFPIDYQQHLYTFIDLLMVHVMGKYRELPVETKEANKSIAYFLGRCLSLMDRGFIFKIIKLYLDRINVARDSVTLASYKFDFLALLTAHEHYVPLNLPISVTPSSSVGSSSKQFNPSLQNNHFIINSHEEEEDEGQNQQQSDPQSKGEDATILSDNFVKTHYIVGALLLEVKSALSEVHQIRSLALNVLRNICVKHSLDDRYSSPTHQTRIAHLYLPFISIILENINRIHVNVVGPLDFQSSSGLTATSGLQLAASVSASPSVSASHSNLASKRVSFIDGIHREQQQSHCSSQSQSSSPSSTLENRTSNRRNSSYCLESTGNSNSNSLNKRDSSYLQMISGTGTGISSPSLGQITTSMIKDQILENDKERSQQSNGNNVDSSTLPPPAPTSVSKSPSPDIHPTIDAIKGHQTEGEEYMRSSSPSLSSLHQQSVTSANPIHGSNHHRSHSLPVRFDKLNTSEVRDMLIIYSWIIKHTSEEKLVQWFTLENSGASNESNKVQIMQFLSLLEMSLHQFKYNGRQQLQQREQQSGQISTTSTGTKLSLKSGSDCNTGNNKKAMTLPARINLSLSEITNHSTTNDPFNSSPSSSLTENIFFSAMLEANLATEIGLVVLDNLGLLTCTLKERLAEAGGDNNLMRKVFAIYLSFLQLGQSEALLKHLFASLRAFINKFPDILFSSESSPLFVGKLCFELLKCCSSRLSSVRNEASAFLYLLMRANFEFTNQTSMTRVHLQVIISVSRLLGDSSLALLNNCRFQESLAVINNYAGGDKGMQMTRFPGEVRDLTKKVRTVLMATAAMREHEEDSEMLLDLQHHLANSYAETSPALRRTWLESMAKNHIKNGNFSEAAHCLAHIAALEAEFLRKRPKDGLNDDDPCIPGPGDFLRISCNITRDEGNGLRKCDDLHGNEEHFSEAGFIETLESTATLFNRAERYEIIPEVYKIMIPLHEKTRNYNALARIYKTISESYDKIISVNKSGRRLLGRYYRVAFYGRVFFEEESGKEYVYKEPKITSLSEISDRLRELFCKKFGSENVKLIMSEKEIDESKDCDPKYAYIQVTHVHPYNHMMTDELQQRQGRRMTDFEKSNNLNRFMFETPFSLSDPSKARSASCENQCKRRTVLTTAYLFPYLVKRILVTSKTVQILSPIEVAIDEMETRVRELEQVIECDPPDLKKLQLKLQGSISVQVNAGPLAYARAFMGHGAASGLVPGVPAVVDNLTSSVAVKSTVNYSSAKVNRLKQVYRDFVTISESALQLNEKLIASDQYEYHEALKSNFLALVMELSQCLRTDELQRDVHDMVRSHAAGGLSADTERRAGGEGDLNVNSGTDLHGNDCQDADHDKDNGEDPFLKRLSIRSFEIFDYISGSSTA